MTSFRILGPVEASIDDRSLQLGGPRQLKLLAFLLLRANQAVSTDVLTEVLWGPGRGRSDNRLTMAVARLRKALKPLSKSGEPRLRTVSGGYMLSVAPGELDTEVFASRVHDGRRAFDAGDPLEASEILGAALALWRGPPLAEVAFDDFAQVEIRRLEEQRLGALEVRIDADLRLGRHAELIAELESLVAAEPTRERLVGQLMLAQYRSGRQADALAVYQRARTRLAEELGLDPGPGLKALQAQILEQADSLESRPVVADLQAWTPTSRPPAPPTSTIGREREIEAVSGLLCRVDVRLVTLVGPGGVGKTRLGLAAARATELHFSDRACWVELAGVARAKDVGLTIANALGVTPEHGESIPEVLRRTLAARQLLLVTDNFEHVVESAVLIGELLAACPGLTVLATSREPLKLSAEHRFFVEPLAVPESPKTATLADLEQASATAMFIAVATRHDNRFSVSPATAPAVARVCSRVDGLPLAIELAAARTRLFEIEELAARLDVCALRPVSA
ncbi:MAG TPA: BTAD domain-containing putative transcriptional regulator [Solirubrobacteraceae bacterium]|nr:BTAD domain-containing putative transcriptional regulator [Solirubrobacteraceae bacterium]